LLLLTSIVPAAPPDGPVAGPPALTRGDRLPFAGEVTDETDTAGQVSRRAYALDVALFVLDVADAYSDVAVFTQLTRKSDPGVVAAAANVMGTAPDAGATATVSRLELVRIDKRGRVSRLTPPNRPSFKFGPESPVAVLPAVPLDAPPTIELGMIVPLPDIPATVGATWAVADGDRPARAITVRGTDVRNGGQCLAVEGVQQSAGWTDLAKVAAGWQRTDRLTVSPVDGMARSVTRSIVHREGKAAVRTITIRYDAKPAVPHPGLSYWDARAEIGTAAWLAEELDKVLAGGKPDPAAVERVRERVKAFVDDRPATAFRPAVDAVRLRADAILAGRALADR
jgi:hypothetical protein